MKNTFSLLFYLKRPKNYVAGSMPIYMRITVDGRLKELSTGKHCEPERWNPKMLRLDGKKEDAKTINRRLKTIEDKIDQAHTGLFKSGQDVIQSIPKQEPVQHHHHFDTKSKVFITSLSVILLTVAVSIGLAVSLGIGYIKSHHEAISYSIARAFYPEVAKYVDEAYSANADKIIREAEIRIEEQKTLSTSNYQKTIGKKKIEVSDSRICGLRNPKGFSFYGKMTVGIIGAEVTQA